MRTRVAIIGILVMLIMAACDKTTEFTTSSVEGTYTGTLSKATSLKSAKVEGGVKADVSLHDSSFVEIHCYGGELDTTLMLHFYEEDDSTFLCFSDEQFQGMFGYTYGSGHMMGGGMMGGNADDWMDEMMDEDYTNSNNVGGFNMMGHSFDYTFNQSDGDSIAHYHFHGTKQ
jgi:hypothetical protein